MTTTTTLGPHQGLLDWLRANKVEYELHEHELAYTARSTARAEGVPPETFAKVVCAVTDTGRHVMFVLEATDHLDTRRACDVLDADSVRLSSEAELADLAPGCEVGAIPAVGDLFDLPVYADYSLRDDTLISFNAGTHQHTVRVERGPWERAANVIYADLAEDMDRRPAWIRS